MIPEAGLALKLMRIRTPNWIFHCWQIIFYIRGKFRCAISKPFFLLDGGRMQYWQWRNQMFHTVQLRHQQNEQVLYRRHISNSILFFMREKLNIKLPLWTNWANNCKIEAVQIRAQININFSRNRSLHLEKRYDKVPPYADVRKCIKQMKRIVTSNFSIILECLFIWLFCFQGSVRTV